jgi:hypothetical protein
MNDGIALQTRTQKTHLPVATITLVYSAEHTKSQTSEGRLITSLCEDVYSLAGVQLRTIRERLTRKSEALAQAVGVIFKNLYEKQIGCRNNFLQDFETCCAAANDFIRMSEKCEELDGFGGRMQSRS